MANKAKQQKFIIDYIKANHCADALDEKFHDEFHARFGGKRAKSFFGASMVFKAQRMLESLYRQGILDRGIIGLTEHEIGFPNWVYSYTLKVK